MRRIVPKFIVQLVTLEQKKYRLTICQDIKNHSADLNLTNIITRDKT